MEKREGEKQKPKTTIVQDLVSRALSYLVVNALNKTQSIQGGIPNEMS